MSDQQNCEQQNNQQSGGQGYLNSKGRGRCEPRPKNETPINDSNCTK